ncbi:CoA ester lyase [Arthrobacter sp. I2-34]|uniref:CoA ester lyase n=1 Tax=Arthrobacter hankyongi TaxID=2904801 RepID=A0ABS9L3S1_9MICC|nr:CoA ester lyase [Arthrobacter hankyongi]MCG2621330.1 CoA ester lyase [Arthrobacter hankyongi]
MSAPQQAAWLPPGPALLFCPADRPERFAKAAARADVAILDLEDGCAPERREQARKDLTKAGLDPERAIVRINPAGAPDHAADLDAVAATACSTVMLAKTESAAQVESVGFNVLALVETPLGAVRATEIAQAANCVGLMWGAEDLVAAMGGSSSRFADAGYRDVARHVRSSVILAAAAFGKFAVDAVHVDIADHEGLRAEAADAAALGLAATACIHPSQVDIIRAAYAPTEEQVAWAKRVLEAAAGNAGASQLDGRMVDAPLFRQAEAIMRRAGSAAVL